MSFIIVYVTHSDCEQAQRVVHHLLHQKLIACANYFPITSSFWWKGNIEESHEIVSLLKTKEANWEKLVVEITKIHPYEIPCIIKIPVEANKVYEDWISSELK